MRTTCVHCAAVESFNVVFVHLGVVSCYMFMVFFRRIIDADLGLQIGSQIIDVAGWSCEPVAELLPPGAGLSISVWAALVTGIWSASTI